MAIPSGPGNAGMAYSNLGESRIIELIDQRLQGPHSLEKGMGVPRVTDCFQAERPGGRIEALRAFDAGYLSEELRR